MVVITSFQFPNSPATLTALDVNVILDKRSLGQGVLIVSERTLCWEKSGGGGFSMDYYNISMHAISKDRTVHEKDCIYILTDPHISMPGAVGDIVEQPHLDNDDGDLDSEPDLSELLLIPARSESVPSIYEAIKHCQELNPDPLDFEDEEENLYEDAVEDMGFEVDESDVNNLAAQLENNLASSNFRNGHNDEDFEDAD